MVGARDDQTLDMGIFEKGPSVTMRVTSKTQNFDAMRNCSLLFGVVYN